MQRGSPDEHKGWFGPLTIWFSIKTKGPVLVFFWCESRTQTSPCVKKRKHKVPLHINGNKHPKYCLPVFCCDFESHLNEWLITRMSNEGGSSGVSSGVSNSRPSMLAPGAWWPSSSPGWLFTFPLLPSVAPPTIPQQYWLRWFIVTVAEANCWWPVKATPSWTQPKVNKSGADCINFTDKPFTTSVARWIRSQFRPWKLHAHPMNSCF